MWRSYAGMYVCLYVLCKACICMYACIIWRERAGYGGCTQACGYACMHGCTCTLEYEGYICVYIYIYTLYICVIYVYIYIHIIYVLYMCIYIYTHYIYVLYMCIYQHIYIMCMYIYIYIYIYIRIIYIYTQICTYIYICMYVYKHIHICQMKSGL
jgi:hypothetical protein